MLNRLVKVCHMYIIFCHFILFKVIPFVTSLIDMSFLLLILFFVFLYIFSFPQLESTHSFSLVHRSPLKMTKPSQATLPRRSINRGHPIIKQNFTFKILSFHIFPLMHLNIPMSITLISWISYFLMAQHQYIIVGLKAIL